MAIHIVMPTADNAHIARVIREKPDISEAFGDLRRSACHHREPRYRLLSNMVSTASVSVSISASTAAGLAAA